MMAKAGKDVVLGEETTNGADWSTRYTLGAKGAIVRWSDDNSCNGAGVSLQDLHIMSHKRTSWHVGPWLLALGIIAMRLVVCLMYNCALLVAI